MDLRMFVMASLTGGLAGISYLIWKKAIKPSLRLLYYDIRLLSALSAGMNTSKMSRNHRTIADVFELTVRDHPNKAFIIFEGVEYTYSYVDKMATKVANLMLSLGVKQGDDVALLLTNCPQFAWIFLGKEHISIFCLIKTKKHALSEKRYGIIILNHEIFCWIKVVVRI